MNSFFKKTFDTFKIIEHNNEETYCYFVFVEIFVEMFVDH